MRVLITGISGFVGPYVAQHLSETEPGVELFGLAWGELGDDELRAIGPGVRLLPGDVVHPPSLEEVLEESLPDVVIHLAAAASGAGSWARPADCFEVNALGTLNLLQAMRELELSPITVVASSGEIYGRVDDNLPLTEERPLRPLSPYAASKASQDLLAFQYHSAFGLPTIRLRLFNHTGPRRPPAFVASSFARQIARIEHGLAPPRLEVGNLDAVRDFTDVRDVARAYLLAASSGRPGEAYNVCTGRGVSVRELLERLLAMSEVEVEVEVDPERLRAADIPVLVGDPANFERATGWSPKIPIEQTLVDLLRWWREQF